MDDVCLCVGAHRITSGEASCDVGAVLAAKYKVEGAQRVVSVTNLWTGEQVGGWGHAVCVDWDGIRCTQ